MSNKMSVREWQQKYANGEFSAPDYSTQCNAGWYDWFCKTESLAGRLKRMAGIVTGISDPYILDNYHVWFKNNCPLQGNLYDDVRFDPLSGERNGRYFMVAVNSPHEDCRYALYTERSGLAKPEFSSDDRRTLVHYINELGPQLAELAQEEDATPDLDDFEPGDDGQVPTAPEMGGMEL